MVNKMDKWQSVFLLLAIGSGLVLGRLDLIENHAAAIVVPCLFMMLYGLFLSVSVNEIGKAFQNKKFTLVSVSLNFIWTPIVAWTLGAVFLADHPALWLGFIMLLVTPCTDWYLVFTGMTGGDMALSAALLPINLILQLVLLPVYIGIFTGTNGTFQVSGLLESVMLIVLLPFLLARATEYVLEKNSRRQALRKNIHNLFGNGQVVFLSLAIAAIFASNGSYLFSNGALVFTLIFPLLLFYVVNFAVGCAVSRIVSFSVPKTVSLHFTTLARNSPLALSIAYTAFPDQPLLILALVTGSLIELPVLAAVSQLLSVVRIRKA